MEIIKVKRGHKNEAQSYSTSVLTQVGRGTRALSFHVHRQEAMRGHRGQVAIYKPRREASPETNPDRTLILNL